jgi:hypothetical protein
LGDRAFYGRWGEHCNWVFRAKSGFLLSAIPAENDFLRALEDRKAAAASCLAQIAVPGIPESMS